MIAAIGKNGVLGKHNALLWHIPEDFKRFKEITIGHPIIMGRRTFESIGKPLPGRTNIVVTRAVLPPHPGIITASSIPRAIEKAAMENTDEIFICGGGQVYAESMSLVERIYLTIIDIEPEGDTFFPDYAEFNKVISEEKKSDEKYSYTFLVLEK
jgi:dihydrofolate reductase